MNKGTQKHRSPVLQRHVNGEVVSMETWVRTREQEGRELGPASGAAEPHQPGEGRGQSPL